MWHKQQRFYNTALFGAFGNGANEAKRWNTVPRILQGGKTEFVTVLAHSNHWIYTYMLSIYKHYVCYSTLLFCLQNDLLCTEWETLIINQITMICCQHAHATGKTRIITSSNDGYMAKQFSSLQTTYANSQCAVE